MVGSALMRSHSQGLVCLLCIDTGADPPASHWQAGSPPGRGGRRRCCPCTCPFVLTAPGKPSVRQGSAGASILRPCSSAVLLSLGKGQLVP